MTARKLAFAYEVSEMIDSVFLLCKVFLNSILHLQQKKMEKKLLY